MLRSTGRALGSAHRGSWERGHCWLWSSGDGELCCSANRTLGNPVHCPVCCFYKVKLLCPEVSIEAQRWPQKDAAHTHPSPALPCGCLWSPTQTLGRGLSPRQTESLFLGRKVDTQMEALGQWVGAVPSLSTQSRLWFLLRGQCGVAEA